MAEDTRTKPYAHIQQRVKSEIAAAQNEITSPVEIRLLNICEMLLDLIEEVR